MALGINHESTGNADIVPIVKYDSKAGRMFRVDRQQGANGYENIPADITKGFKAVVDLENVEVGYMNFDTGGAPDFAMVPLGSPFPTKPTEKHRQGVRIMMKLHASCGGDVREMSTVAKAALRGVDALHDAYEAGKTENTGKLPIVVVKDTIPVTTGEGARKSTNYSPVFEIIGWAPRPTDLVFKPKGRPASPQQASHQTNQPSDRGAPPSNGSTQVGAPSAKAAEPETAKQPEMAMAGEDDFG